MWRMHYGNSAIRTDLRPQSARGSSPEMLIAGTGSTNGRIDFRIALWAGPSIAKLINGPPSSSCEGGSLSPVLRIQGRVSKKPRNDVNKSHK